jgi:filamentous hemagglutinin family protein
MNKFLVSQLKLVAIATIFGVLNNFKVSAQVIPDNTLGSENTIINTNPSGLEINGGATRGSNLFHSFQEFSISTGGSVLFNKTTNIQNIISRVTGGNISNINGLIRANGAANLFLLNPNGITFGTGARLNIGGSFFATTASDLRFSDGSIFSANPAKSSSLLTVSTPIGLQLGTRGDINNSGRLVVKPGQNISLNGSNLIHTGELVAPNGKVELLGLRLALFPNSLIDVSGDNGGGQVLIGNNITQSVYIDKLANIKADALTNGNGGEIKVFSTDSTRVYGTLSAKSGVESGNGGLIETSGKNFLDVAGIKADASTVNGLSGTWLLDPRNITLVNSEEINNPNNNPNSTIISNKDVEAQLNAGTNVTISTDSSGSEAGNITADNFDIAKTSDNTAILTLQAANDIDIKNSSIRAENGRLGIILEADSDNSGQGNINIASFAFETGGEIFKLTAAERISILGGGAGNVTKISSPTQDTILKADTISLKNLGIISSTESSATSGNIKIDAKNTLNIENSAVNNNSFGDGNSGFINVNAGNILIKNTTFVTRTAKGGNAGDINITVNGDFKIEKAEVGSQVGNMSIGSSGNLNIESKNLLLDNNGRILNQTQNNKINGDINIKTGSLIIENTGGIFSNSIGQNPNVLGNGGNINITADSIKLSDKVGIGSNTITQGNAGNINIKTGSLLVEMTSGITSNSEPTNDNLSGKAGNIDITADSVNIENSAGISSSTLGSGNGGNINIKSRLLTLDDKTDFPSRSNISVSTGIVPNSEGNKVSTENTGNAGTINITSDEIFLNRAEIIGQTRSLGNGGKITINSQNIKLDNQAKISTSATRDSRPSQVITAGDIEIIARRKITLDNQSKIDSSTTENLTENSNIITPLTAENRALNLDAGDITLDVGRGLLLRNTSNISTKAGNQTVRGNGGNIKINVPFIVTLVNENSDITAGATSGRGGAIDIITKRIFGIAVSSQQNPLENTSNDINSASGDPSLNGTITINTSGIDPSQGLIELPSIPIDSSKQIAQGCGSLNTQNKLISTGRGGLPPTPNDLLGGEVIWEDMQINLGVRQKVSRETEGQPKASNNSYSHSSIPSPATGWVFNNKGEVTLISQHSNSYGFGFNNVNCLEVGEAREGSGR